jgi:hypothetical protein
VNDRSKTYGARSPRVAAPHRVRWGDRSAQLRRGAAETSPGICRKSRSEPRGARSLKGAIGLSITLPATDRALRVPKTGSQLAVGDTAQTVDKTPVNNNLVEIRCSSATMPHVSHLTFDANAEAWQLLADHVCNVRR